MEEKGDVFLVRLHLGCLLTSIEGTSKVALNEHPASGHQGYHTFKLERKCIFDEERHG